MEATLYTVVQIHEHEDPGDILVVFFLPGQEEIEDVSSLLRQFLQEKEVQVQYQLKCFSSKIRVIK